MLKAIAKSEEITASLRDPADWLIAFDRGLTTRLPKPWALVADPMSLQ
jgi:hypothetical protein